MKCLKKIFCIVLALGLLITCSISASAADYTDSANDSASNWLTGSNAVRMVYTRPMYNANQSVFASDLGLQSLEKLSDIYARDGKLYVMESAQGQLIVTDENYNVLQTIKTVTGPSGEEITFVGARGVYVDKYGKIYIADTDHNRVLILDSEGKYVNQLLKPESEMWPDELLYNPVAVVVDNMDYVYVLSDGSYYGAVMYTPEYEFKGFFGANTVSTSTLAVLKRVYDLLFTNNTKLSKSAKALPYSFVDMELGADGYLYTCTGATKGQTAKGSLKRLNPTGSNILKDKTSDTTKDSNEVVFATESTSKMNCLPIGHDLSNVTVDENNYTYVLDSSYGRIYMYDIECNLLTTIGGGVTSGTQDGTFKNAKAITVMNGTLYGIDETKGCIVSFTINEYGKLVQKAQTKTINGDYVDAEPLWYEVLRQDTNNILAYRGIAKAELINENYNEAMKYAKLGFDRGVYSQAYEYVREDFLARNFILIVVIIILVIVALVVLLKLKKKHGITLIKNKKLRVALSMVTHPADSLYEIKYNGQGSWIIGTLIVAVWYVFKIIGVSTGFIYNKSDINDVNAWYSLVQTFGLVILFSVANWAVSVLFEGKGKLKDVYAITCYSTIPLVIQSALYDILSNVLTAGESSYISIITYVCYILTAVILIMGIITIQDFSFGKFLFTTIVTVLAMLLIVFIIFLLAILLQQAGDFVKTVFMEVAYR